MCRERTLHPYAYTMHSSERVARSLGAREASGGHPHAVHRARLGRLAAIQRKLKVAQIARKRRGACEPCRNTRLLERVVGACARTRGLWCPGSSLGASSLLYCRHRFPCTAIYSLYPLAACLPACCLISARYLHRLSAPVPTPPSDCHALRRRTDRGTRDSLAPVLELGRN